MIKWVDSTIKESIMREGGIIMKELIARRGGTSQKGLSYGLTGSSRSQFVARIGKSPGLKCQVFQDFGASFPLTS
jgi:hypothetical protein